MPGFHIEFYEIHRFFAEHFHYSANLIWFSILKSWCIHECLRRLGFVVCFQASVSTPKRSASLGAKQCLDMAEKKHETCWLEGPTERTTVTANTLIGNKKDSNLEQSCHGEWRMPHCNPVLKLARLLSWSLEGVALPCQLFFNATHLLLVRRCAAGRLLLCVILCFQGFFQVPARLRNFAVVSSAYQKYTELPGPS